MIHTLLNYSQDATFSQLQSQLYIKDDNDDPEDCDASGKNTVFFLRQQYISASKTIDLQGRIYHSLFTTKIPIEPSRCETKTVSFFTSIVSSIRRCFS